MRKRVLSILLAAVMVVSLLPMTAFAEATKPEGSEWLVDSGDNHVWYKLEEVPASSGTYTLTIGGEGAMPDYLPDALADRPWHAVKDSITTVVIESGVTTIGYDAFNGFESLESVTIPSSVTSLWAAFTNCIE